MKKIYSMLFAMLATGITYATTINVSITDFTFSPSFFTAEIGDVVVWTQNGSSAHTTTSTGSIPAGAASWNSGTMAGGSGATFNYTITAAGSYTYICQFHSGMGMVAGFSVNTPTGVKEMNLNFASVASPNPFKDKVTIAHPKAELLKVYNVTGKLMNTFSLEAIENKSEIDLSALPKGIYFYSLVSEGAVIETKKIVKSE